MLILFHYDICLKQFEEVNDLPAIECPISITMQKQTTKHNRPILNLFSARSHKMETQQFVMANHDLTRGGTLRTLIIYIANKLNLLNRLLTHLPLVTHICAGELGQHWFR